MSRLRPLLDIHMEMTMSCQKFGLVAENVGVSVTLGTTEGGEFQRERTDVEGRVMGQSLMQRLLRERRKRCRPWLHAESISAREDDTQALGLSLF